MSLRPYFQTVLHSDSVSNGKPHSGIYIKAAANLGLHPRACLVFEDSVVGALAGSRAGRHVIVITTTHHEEEFKDISNIIRFEKDFSQISFHP